MATCSFCANNYPAGTGMTVISKSGAVSHYCSHKCEVNAKKRNPTHTRWSKKYAKRT